MLDINIKTIPHKTQRYETCGDWRGDVAGQVAVKVSAMVDWRYEFLVALHELIEGTLCNARGIKDADVSAFDKAHERARQAMPDTFPHRTDHGFAGRDEPGDEPKAPYRREHFFATTIERLMAAELGVDWQSYEQAIGAM